MAELLDTFTPPANKNKKYPWETWIIPGQTVRLVQGEDYTCTTISMRATITAQARKMGLKVKSYIETIMLYPCDKPEGCEAEAIVFQVEGTKSKAPTLKELVPQR